MSTITLLPALSDNYIVIVESGAAVMVVDPGEAAPVLAWAESHKAPTHILLTHHHSDHIGGAAELAAKFGAKMIGARADAARLPKLDQAVADGDHFTLGADPIEVMATPGHTLGHIAYILPQAKALFAGDTLFSLGCGRLFEGSPEQMFQSLERLKTLPPETRLYCGHEYTFSNARFASSLMPRDLVLKEEVALIKAKHDKGEPTLPSTLGYERRYNPFLNCTNAAEFSELRKKKDNFK